MNIDWSKAPEGATHYFVGAASGEWRDLSGKTWEYWHKGAWFNSGLSSSHLLTYPGDMIAVQRPPLEWTGEGLPPAGTVCEVLNNTLDRPEWERCTVLFMGKFKAVYESESCHERVADVSEDWMISFRPLRTLKQIAAEEREKAISEISKILGSLWASEQEAAGYLYDAGYRKQEQTK